MLNNWIKIFLYQAKHNKFFTLLNIIGLSLGISGLVFAILYWNDEHAYNAWNPEKNTVFQMSNVVGDGMIWSSNIAPIGKYIREIPEVEQICYLNGQYSNEIIDYKGKKEEFKILDTQRNFFSFFPFEFIKGDINTALQDNTSITLSEEAAQRLFGNENALGKQVQYNGKTMVVRGVYRIPGKSSYAPLAVTTNLIDSRLKADDDQWGNFTYTLLLKLKNPEQINIVKKKIEDLLINYRLKQFATSEGMSLQDYVKKNGRPQIFLEQLAIARLHSIVDGYPEGRGNYQFLLIMAGLSLLILILSIVNYVNLATANAVKRAKEVGVRKILGASKSNLVTQFIFETVITTVFSILLALVIVELALPYYNDFLNKSLVIHSNQFYVELIVIFVIVVVVSGIFPALYVSNFESLKVLKGNFSRSKSGTWLRNSMLILQFAIAAFFITGSYIIYQQVNYISTKDLGLHGEQVIEIEYRKKEEEDPKLIYDRYVTIKQELQKIKGVQNVSAGAFSFGNTANSSSGFTYNDQNIQGQNMAVDFEMLNMMQIKIAQGRQLSEKFASDTINSMLINEVAMKMMNEKEPLGKEIAWNNYKLKIVGVVKDFHLSGPQDKIPPMAFFHFKTINWMSYNLNKVYVKIDPENMEQTIADIDKFWATKVDREYPLKYDFVDKNYARTYQTYIKQRNLFSLLNIVVIAIALFGLFALASYSIERRMKEIAIRKTLGAETSTLLATLSKQYIIFCITGFLIAALPAWILLDKWLDNFAFRVPVSVTPFFVGFIVLMALTLTVVLSRAYMATRVNVLKYLKYE